MLSTSFFSTLKSVIVFLVLAGIQVNSTQNLPNQTTSFPPLITPGSDTPSCPAQQQRENALREFRRMIVSNLAMLTQCGGGYWIKLAYLDMSDPLQSCPPAWRDRSTNGVRVCGRTNSSNNECHSTFYPSDGRLYTKVCGRVIGYQFGHPDGFRYRFSYTVNQPYVDGVSITHGSPRSHIWTFAADGSEADFGCPCEGGSSAPPFVGSNYFCESGHNGAIIPSCFNLYTSDPLWGGEQCESEGSCCSTAPWFTVDLVNPKIDDIEVRICSDSRDTEEDTPIQLLEVYVQ